MKVKNHYVKHDKYDLNGKWLKSWCINDQDFYNCYHSLSGSRWRDMLKRCDPESHVVKKNPSYLGVTCNFRDFQEFVEWSRSEYGYDFEYPFNSTARMWHLEKDLLAKGNKIYSPDTCLFVPLDVNQLLVTHKNKRGDFPIGVSLQNGKYFAGACRVGGR